MAEQQPPMAAAPTGKACLNCGEIGHLRRECPSPAQCNCCGGTDHIKVNCQLLATAQCGICGKTGHLDNKCNRNANGTGGGAERAPRAKKSSNSGNKACLNCGQIGHFHRRGESARRWFPAGSSGRPTAAGPGPRTAR